MKPTKLFVTSDWHLDAVTAGVARFDELCDLAHHVVRHAITHEGGFVFAGDLTDPDAPSSHRCTAFAVELYSVLRSAGVASLWETGNHDVVEDGYATSTLTPLRSAGATVVSSPGIYDVQGVAIGCLPYTPKTHAYSPADSVRRWAAEGVAFDVVIGHLNSSTIIPGSESHEMPRGRDMNWPLAELAEHYPTVPLVGGHYHNGGRYGTVEIIGAPARFTFAEQGNEPSFLEVDVTAQGTVVRRHLFPNPRRVYSVPLDKGIVDTVQPGDIVRVLAASASETSDDALNHMVARLGQEGAAAVRVKRVDHEPAAPIDLVQRPAGEGTNEDGFAAADRLAREWPNADAEFRVALTGLVKEIGEQSR